MDQPSHLAISKNECHYVVQSLRTSIGEIDKQQAKLSGISIPGENNLELVLEYYERRRQDLQTLIEKYQRVFS